MDNLNTVPSNGTFGQAVNVINQNFGKTELAINQAEENISNLQDKAYKDVGYFASASALEAAYPQPTVGMYAGVWNGSNAYIIYQCDTAGTWTSTGNEDPRGLVIDSSLDATSDNPVKNKVIANEVALGSVYDVTAHNNGATFASLDALLSNANIDTYIPIAIRKGGMSVKFVLSSDNKYVQYRFLLSGSFTDAQFANSANWQGVDVNPVAGSRNLVESGGVESEILQRIPYVIVSEDNNQSTYNDVVIKQGHTYRLFKTDRFTAGDITVYVREWKASTGQLSIYIRSSESYKDFTADKDYKYIMFYNSTPTTGGTEEMALFDVTEFLMSQIDKKTKFKTNEELNSVGIDNAPIITSDNLIKSKGVAKANELLSLLIENIISPSPFSFTTDDNTVSYSGNFTTGVYIKNGTFYPDISFIKTTDIIENTSSLPKFIALDFAEAGKTYANLVFFDDSNNVIAALNLCKSGRKVVQIPGGTKFKVSVSTSVQASDILLWVVPSNQNVDVVIPQIKENSEIYIETKKTVVKSDNGYINSDGELSSPTSTSFVVKTYSVNHGELYKITNEVHSGSRLAYAFYTNNDFTGLVEKGPVITGFVDGSVIPVPANANYLCVSFEAAHISSVYEVNQITCQEFYDVQQTINNTITPYAYAKDGENLYLAYTNGNGVEYVYWFKKCMANELYTFYRVGYRNINRSYPSINGISSLTDVVVLNETGSDNIGPIVVSNEPNVRYTVGGNHHYPNESADVKYKTAENISFDIYVDGKVVTEQNVSEKLCSEIVVKVKNAIYSPFYPPSSGDTSLSHLLCYEYVTYMIVKNNIEVAVQHQYANDASGTIDSYWGMQSMMKNDNYIMTPRGQYAAAWESTTGSHSFTKTYYPDFNRFIEKSNDGYQAAYLLPDFGIGNHQSLISNRVVYEGNGSKNYHHMIAGLEISANMVYQWRGVYTFFKLPRIENTDVFVYGGSIKGKDSVFINTKGAFAGNVVIPETLALKKLVVVENSGFVNEQGTTDIQVGGNGIYLSCSNPESIILCEE